MKITYCQAPDGAAESLIKKIAFECDVLYDTAKLLFYRGIKDEKTAKCFLNAGKNNFHDPYLFSSMTDVVKRLIKARAECESVLVFGDYDVDGISAVTILSNCLEVFGIKAQTVVPEREEGYGINVEKILSMEIKPQLIITVDCGISESEKISVLNADGIDVIVTDHHEPPEDLPDCLILNPKTTDSGYPFDGLCGAGVAYKLGYALIGESADEYLDYVALATVSDSMELIGENRDIVTEGLKMFNDHRLRPCFAELLGENVKTVTAHTLAFSVAPKINAGGRMGDANSSLKLFKSKSRAEISKISELLKAYNVQRQIECENIYKEAVSQIRDDGQDYVIAVKNEKWNSGFTGIVASRLADCFSRPVVVFGGQNGVLKGSARGVGDVNVFNILSAAKDLFVSFGGHAQAAGVTVEEKDFDEFKRRINEYYVKEYGTYLPEKSVCAEWKAQSPFSMRFIKELERLEPFGVGNRRPCFGVSVGKVKASPLKVGSPHYSFETDVISMLDFNGERDADILSLPVEKTVVFETNYSVFRGKESVKGFVREIVADYGDFTSLYGYIVKNELDKAADPTDIKVDMFEKPVNGALYAVSDADNISKTGDFNKMPISVFYPSSGCVVLSPKSTEGYESVVFLDQPLSFNCNSSKVYCNYRLKGYGFIHNINTDRESMANFYRKIISFVGKDMSDPVDFYYKNDLNMGIENFLFALKVFSELKILTLSDGKLTVSGNKSSLTESSVYNIVVELRGL